MKFAMPRIQDATASGEKAVLRWDIKVNGHVHGAIACAHAPTLLAALSASLEAGNIPIIAAPHQRERLHATASFERRPHGAEVGFLTSGSTGDARVVWKSAHCLHAEARELARLFLSPGDSRPVVALVPPCHLYGFLFSALLPGLANVSVCFIEPGLPPASVPQAALLVAVPALFPYVLELLEARRLQGPVVFSGAPLGEGKRALARAVLAQTLVEAFDLPPTGKLPVLGMYEVLGSTESGGLGVSSVATARAAFAPLPGVRIIPRAMGALPMDAQVAWSVSSPYLFPHGASLDLDDRLERLPSGAFLYHGRSDRVFKYSGRRFSLGEIEERLVKISGAARCLCAFQEDPSLPKGGILIAFLERAGLASVPSPEALRKAWVSHECAPFPQFVHVLDAFPVDALGKVTLRNLLGEVNHGSRQQDL